MEKLFGDDDQYNNLTVKKVAVCQAKLTRQF